MQGSLTEMSVADLIQHNCQNQKTALYRIRNDGQLACLYFSNGEIVHAELEDMEGEEVIYEVLKWEAGTFDLDAGVESSKTTIKRKWQALLLEGARLLDEQSLIGAHSEPNESQKGKDNKMNIKKLNKVVEDLQEDLGSALLSTASWKTSDGQPLAGYNTQPKSTALFNELARSLNKTLQDSEMDLGLGNYFLINLENNHVAVDVIQGELQQGILVDLSKTTLGILINVTLPKVISGLKEATQ